MLSVQRPGPLPNSQAALGSIIIKRPDSDVLWHDGGTAGYSSFIGYIPSRKSGVIVLSNMLFGAGIQDVGFHILDERIPVAKAPGPRTRVTVSAEALKAFIGRYELRSGFIATVTQDGDRLFVQPTNQPRQEVFQTAQDRSS